MNFHEKKGECLLCILLGASVIPARLFRVESRIYVVGEVHCTGTETELLECSHASIGHHRCGRSIDDADDVAIVCGTHLQCVLISSHPHTHKISCSFHYNLCSIIYLCLVCRSHFIIKILAEQISCENGDVRLRGGIDSSNGRVEVCQFGTWGAVCSDG